MPIPSYALVRKPGEWPRSGGPGQRPWAIVGGRVIDLATPRRQLGLLGGSRRCSAAATFADIRAGSWRREPRSAGDRRTAPGDPLVAASGLWLQLGSYRSREAAQTLLQRALFEAEVVVQVQPEGRQFRVMAGPFDGRDQARQAADRLRRLLGVSALLIER